MKIKYFAWVAEIIDKREEEIKVPDHVTDVNTLINFLCTKDESYEAAFANK
jgi:molybdopterin converting factor small subunit